MIKLLHIISIGLAVTVSPRAAPGGGHPRSATASTALDNLRSAYLGAYNTGNADAMESLYTSDAVRMPYDAPAERGRDAIVSGYRRAFAARRFHPELTFIVDQTLVRGDVAVERGAYREDQHFGESGPTRIERGKYVAVARRGDDGVWRYDTSIFNRDAVPRPSRTGH